jgi:hypothetical protein
VGSEVVAVGDIAETDADADVDAEAADEVVPETVDDGSAERVGFVVPPFPVAGPSVRADVEPAGTGMAGSSTEDTASLGPAPELNTPLAMAMTAAVPTPTTAVPASSLGLRRAGARRRRPAAPGRSGVRADEPPMTGPSKSRRSSWATGPTDCPGGATCPNTGFAGISGAALGHAHAGGWSAADPAPHKGQRCAFT